VTSQAQTQIDAAYQSQRLRLNATVVAAAASAWASQYKDRQRAIAHIVRLVTAGQAHTVRLVDAYMTAKAIQATGSGARVGLDPAKYSTAALRGVAADVVYGRPFGAYGALVKDGAHPGDAVKAAQASVTKLAATDLQLAQTHAARDWMQATAEQATGDIRIVGYRRVTGSDPCALCAAAATRTYRISDLLPLHESCQCTVQSLWGTEPVASIGTTVRVEMDPELGPRLMAESWSPVGPRLTAYEEPIPKETISLGSLDLTSLIATPA
jgi:hypothetical protein